MSKPQHITLHDVRSLHAHSPGKQSVQYSVLLIRHIFLTNFFHKFRLSPQWVAAAMCERNNNGIPREPSSLQTLKFLLYCSINKQIVCTSRLVLSCVCVCTLFLSLIEIRYNAITRNPLLCVICNHREQAERSEWVSYVRNINLVLTNIYLNWLPTQSWWYFICSHVGSHQQISWELTSFSADGINPSRVSES
jgi:hypothetical protein